jgi:hypothetical protein
MTLGLRWVQTPLEMSVASCTVAKRRQISLNLIKERGARGIRTLVAGYPNNRISRKRTWPDWARLGPSPEYAPTHRTDSNRLDPTSGWHRRWHRRIGHRECPRSLMRDLGDGGFDVMLEIESRRVHCTQLN